MESSPLARPVREGERTRALRLPAPGVHRAAQGAVARRHRSAAADPAHPRRPDLSSTPRDPSPRLAMTFTGRLRRLLRIDAFLHSLPVEVTLHSVEVEGVRGPAADDPSRPPIGVCVPCIDTDFEIDVNRTATGGETRFGCSGLTQSRRQAWIQRRVRTTGAICRTQVS